jgi:hypothetical protein
MDTGMSITQRDATDAVNGAGLPSWCGNVFCRIYHSLERTLLVLLMMSTAPDQRIASLVCLWFYRTALPIKTAILSPRPHGFDKASASRVGSHCKCGFHVRHA